MPDLFDANGLEIKTYSEAFDALVESFKAAYGDDINVDQNSPDGQIIGITAQIATDLRELLAQINAGFDPDQAVGVILDQRVAINNVKRAGGTYTIQPCELEVTGTTTLQGLDGDFENPDGQGFTLADDSGNEWILIDSQTLTAGTHTINFRARNVGLVETTPETITNFVTIDLAVASANNPSGALEIGEAEEPDSSLRLRRKRSVANASNGYLNGIEAALLAIAGVTEAIVYENFTNAPDANGTGPHSIWAIVEGGSNEDIGAVIYGKKSYGANMRGAVTVPIDSPNGNVFVAKFDRPTAESLHVRFDIQPTKASAVFDQEAIKASIVAGVDYSIGQYAETAELTGTSLQAIIDNGGGGVPVNLEISKDGSTWDDYLAPDSVDRQFVLDAARITITEV